MILVDANLLVYSHVGTFEQHPKANTWFDSVLNGPAPLGIPWPSVLAFVRIVSNPRIFEQPETVSEAWKQAEEWLACPPVWVPTPTERHQEILGPLLRNQTVRSNLVPDAHLAALAIEHGLLLCSTDGDFARFPGLKWENPIA